MSSELASLRSTLQDLQSSELPANYRTLLDKENDPNAKNSNTNGDDDDDDDAATNKNNDIIDNPQLLQRYKSARNSYIQQQTLESFLRSLQKYDPATNTIPLPDSTTTDADREALKQRQDEILELVKGTMRQVNGGIDDVRVKWEQFCEKREELAQIVEGMERSERNRQLEEGDHSNNENDMDMEDNDDDEEITEEDVALQEEKLDELQQRKTQLENRLRSVRGQILDVEDDCHRTKRVVNEVRVRGGRKPLDWRGLSSGGSDNGKNNGADNGSVNNSGKSGNEGTADNEDENVEYISVVAQGVESEIADMEEKAAELKKSCDFYDGIRELMEELGGVKILSSKSVSAVASSSSPPTSSSSNSNREGMSPEKRQKLDNKEGEGFVLTLMLLGSHILEITLAKSQNDKDGLQISNAKLTTQTSFPIPETNNDDETMNEQTASLMETMHSISHSNLSFSKIMSQKQSVSITIPPLDDLVSWSHSLESSSHGIRFILVETLARLRTLEARVVELTQLRERYAAQVYNVESPSSQQEGIVQQYYGGAEQEVVCATINEGVTVALRLGADCPLVPGSVYISEIFGVGGWEESKLEELKAVVLEKRCRGPVEVMKCLVKEIRRRSSEEGWVVPATPSLPRGK
ncbi:hypothetical protein ACHAXR_003743 [Thalassiosira sp. AJA248-18]